LQKYLLDSSLCFFAYANRVPIFYVRILVALVLRSLCPGMGEESVCVIVYDAVFDIGIQRKYVIFFCQRRFSERIKEEAVIFFSGQGVILILAVSFSYICRPK
jgi:hypothetical protein